jgi:EAL domain-containing protein (putative c-di-GMP-specific phosphodiesterase class I)
VHAKLVVEEFSIEQIVPYFQPIFDLRNHKVMRYECLSRLITENDNVYLPSDFLHIISRSQWSAQLTQRMIQISSAYCLSKNMRWSINMFPSDLRDATLVRWMQDLFSKLNSNLVGLELAYDSVKDNPHLLLNLLEKMPNVHVTIDDVHTFENKLIEVIETGVHAIKIRGDMVTRFARTGEKKSVIENIMKHCKSTKCDLIAEHIEDDNTLDAVSNLGIGYGQGYFLSQPQARMTNLKHV